MSEPAKRLVARERIDRAVLRDAGWVARSPAVWAFVAIVGLAAAVQVLRGGPDRLGSVALIALGVIAFAILAWFAGRHEGAVQTPIPVRWPVGEFTAILAAYAGLVLWLAGYGSIGGPVFLGGVAGWLAAAVLARYRPGDFSSLLRSPIPFAALLLAVALPKVVTLGPLGFALALPAALVSGIFQQVLLQDGLVARLEALSRRTDAAAVLAALAFGVAHAPMNLQQAQGDHVLALSASLVFQAPIALVFIVGYLRHRASVPLGVAHGFAIA